MFWWIDFVQKLWCEHMFREWWQIRPSTFFHQNSWCCRFLWHMLKFSNFQKWRILRVETKYSKISTYCAMKIGHFLWSGLKSRNGISEQKMVQKSSLFRFMGQNENSCHIRKFWKCPKIDFSQNSFSWTRIGSKMLCFESKSHLVTFLKRITFSCQPL